MRQASVLLGGVWEFVVGDDWRTALGVLLALALTALLADASISAWWVMPLAVLSLLALSIRRAARVERRPPSVVRGRDEPGLVGEDDDLNAVPQLELGEDSPDVGLDGCLGEHEPLGDLGV